MKKQLLPSCLLLCVMTYLTLDVNAQHWSVLSSTYNNVDLEDVYANGDTIVAVGSDISGFVGHTLYSFDGGATWDTTVLSSGYLLKGIAFANATNGSIIALGSIGCTLRSTDGGATWAWNWCEPMGTQYHGAYDIQYLDQTTGYMFGYGHTQFFDGTVFKTTDGGQNWNNISGNIPKQPMEYGQMVDANVGFAGSYLFGHDNLYRSIDGGTTWDSLDVKGMEITGVHFLNAARGFACTNTGKIYETNDTATTWNEVADFPGEDLNDIVFRDNQVGVAVGFNGIVVKTIDGGNTWNTVSFSSPFSGGLIRVRAFDGLFYAAGFGGVVVRSDMSVGIDEVRKTIDVKVVPNPSNGDAYFFTPGVQTPLKIEIADIYGRLVKVVEANGERTQLNGEDLSPGTYVYSVKGLSDKIYTGGKFVIK